MKYFKMAVLICLLAAPRIATAETPAANATGTAIIPAVEQPASPNSSRDAIKGETRFYNMGDGLPSNNVLSISLMEELPYVGTSAGVSDFDGSTWRAYPARDGFPTDTVSFIMVLENFGVMGVSEGFYIYMGNAVIKKYLPARGTSAAGAGKSMFFGTDRGLFARDWETLQSGTLECVEGLCGTPVSAVVYDGGNGVWAAADDGLYHVSENGKAEKRQGPETGGKITALFVDGAGSLWAGTEKGLFMLPAGIETWGEISCLGAPCGRALSLSGRGKHLWLGTTEGAFRFGGGTRAFKGKTYLPDDRVNSIAGDIDGGAWAATPAGVAHIVPID